MSAKFWDSHIKPLMIASQDTHVLVAVLDPNPINYFYPTFGCYNFAKFPVSITGHDYWDTLQTDPKDSPADAMLFNSETVVWVPLSAKWAIWGERSFGTCVLAFENDQIRLATDNITKTLESASFALESFVSYNFKNNIVPEEFFYSIMKNYPNKCRKNTRCFLCLSESNFGSNFCQKHVEELKCMLDEKTNLVEKPEWEHHCRLCGASEESKIIRYKNRGPDGYEYYIYFCDKDTLEEWRKYHK